MKRILVLATRGASTWMLVHELRRNFHSVHIVIEDKEPTSTFIRRRLRKLGLWHTLGQLAFAIYGRYAARRAAPANQACIRYAGLDATPLADDDFIHVESVNDARSQGLVQTLCPDVVVVCGTRILRSAILGATEAKFVNAHYGVTPRYRGVHGAYWALVAGDRANCGITVHLVDESVDTGPILYQSMIAPSKNDNFFTYPTLQAIAATPLVVRAVRDCLEDRASVQQGVEPSRQWYHPTLWGYFWTGIRRGVW